MSWMSRLNRHTTLASRMADTLGVDLAEEMMRGKLTPEEWRGAVLSCTGCSNPDGCEAWLDVHGDGAEHTPGYCRNKDRFEALARPS